MLLTFEKFYLIDLPSSYTSNYIVFVDRDSFVK
jgi:hypothetical protein